MIFQAANGCRELRNPVVSRCRRSRSSLRKNPHGTASQSMTSPRSHRRANGKSLPSASSVNHLHLLATIVTLARSLPAGTVHVLDIGCGDGLLLGYLHSSLREIEPERNFVVQGFDVTDFPDPTLAFPNQTLQHLNSIDPCVDWTERIRGVKSSDPWPYADGSCDLVLSNQVLEHVHDRHLFLSECARVLRPGGTGIHVFPLRSTLYEWHLKMPLIHRIRDPLLRSRLIEGYSRLGLGLYLQRKDMNVKEYADNASAYIDRSTNYASWSEIVAATHDAGLEPSHRYTGQLYSQKLHSLFGRRSQYSYRQPTRLADVVCFVVASRVASITLTCQKPVRS